VQLPGTTDAEESIMRRLLHAIPIVCICCGGQPQHAPAAAPQAETRSEPRLQSPEIQQLAAAVEDVPLLDEQPTHARVVTALSRLAHVVRATEIGAASKIEQLTTELMQSPPNAAVHADLVKDALSIALDAFAVRLEREPSPPARDAYVLARAAAQRITAGAPLGDQVFKVTGALRGLTNLAAAIEGSAPPFAVSDDVVQIGYDPSRLQERVARANAAVAELAKETDWKRAGQKASHALEAFAAVIEVAPLAMPAQEWRSLVRAVRFEALELSRRGSLSLDVSDQVKNGLIPCVDALRAIQTKQRNPTLGRLLATATGAVEAVDPNVVFVFQRAIIQEAFRSIADGFVVIAEAAAQLSSDVARMSRCTSAEVDGRRLPSAIAVAISLASRSQTAPVLNSWRRATSSHM
jgi:hypothetical protein